MHKPEYTGKAEALVCTRRICSFKSTLRGKNITGAHNRKVSYAIANIILRTFLALQIRITVEIIETTRSMRVTDNFLRILSLKVRFFTLTHSIRVVNVYTCEKDSTVCLFCDKCGCFSIRSRLYSHSNLISRLEN